MVSFTPFRSGIGRSIAIAMLAAIPLATLWNVIAAQIAPERTIRVLKLSGVTNPPPPVSWSWRAVADGTLQAALARAVGEAPPLRPLFIRINNEVLYTLFGEINAEDVLEGDRSELFVTSSIVQYCSRSPEGTMQKAERLIPRLRDIQSYYAAHNRIFLYVITPSKAAHLPEYFLGRVPCANSESDRATYLPTVARLLRDAGINALDTASLVHALKGRESADLFPRGGGHWSQLGLAHAADAVVAELDRLAGSPLMPRIHWRYEMVDGRQKGLDADLAELMNLLVPRVHYPVPRVTYLPTPPCADQPWTRLGVALIGTSFTDMLADALIAGACLKGAYAYRYMQVRHGAAADTWRLTQPSDEEAIRNADIAILEENEGQGGEFQYIDRLRAITSQR
jgi:hypothetical protein